MSFASTHVLGIELKPALIAGAVVACVVVAGLVGYLVTKALQPSEGVVGVTLNNPTGTTANSTMLSWPQSSDNDFVGYAIYQSTTSAALGSQVATITNRATTSYTVTGLSPNTTYYFTVRVNR